MKKIFTLLLMLCAINSFAQIRISQVYGGGGNAGATYNQDFVELFNAGTAAVDISGWSVQYASATGPSGAGNWAPAVIPASTSINPGKYYLIAMATGGTGVALPTPDFTFTTINMGGAAGKVALVNTSTALNGTTACSNASVVDVIGFAATAGAASCGEGSIFITTGIGNTLSMHRKSNGCTDANNNSVDFEVLTVAPRNSASAANPCTGGPTPSLTATPAVTGLAAATGTPSNVGSYNLVASDLTPAAGNISVTPGANVEIATAVGGPFGSSAINVAYAAGAVTTTLYTRIAATAPVGAFAGTITHAGGGASNAVLNVTGVVSASFYNTKSNSGLNNLATWSTTVDGTGPSPANFTDAYQYFNVVNQANANYSGVLSITPTTSRLVVGNGTNPLTLTILPGIDSVTSATRVDVLNNATVVLQNDRRPFFNNLATGSTVDFAQTGVTSADTVRVPAISFYNLKLTGGLKYFAGGTITTRGDLTFDGVVSTNGGSPTFTTINALGNVSFLNNSAFEPAATGDAARLTLKMNSTDGSSTLSAANTDVMLFRLQRDSADAHTIVVDGTGAVLTLGNATSGGLQLVPAATTLSLGEATLNVRGGGFVTNSSEGKIFTEGGNIIINKTAGTGNAGALRFETDSYLNNFTINLGPSLAADSVIIATDITVNGTASLTNGKISMATGQVFAMANGSTIAGGSAASFVRGIVSKFGNTAFNFPVGKANKYAPVSIANVSAISNFSVEHFNSVHPVGTIDPATASTYPSYNLSTAEHWVINRFPAANADITFNYTDASSNINTPTLIRIAHFDGTDWNDIGGTPAGGNTVTSGSITVNNVSVFSPFTFGAITNGVLPVTIKTFAVQKAGNNSKIFWTTEQEVNSKHFVVERSTDGRTWTTVATIAAAGNSTTSTNYSTTDFAPAKGINFYRLKIVDLDNKFANSAQRSVLFGNADVVLITPNPATTFATIYMGKTNNSISQIFVTDMNGKLVERINTADQTQTIQTARYGKGLYIIKVVTEGATSTHKLVVQ